MHNAIAAQLCERGGRVRRVHDGMHLYVTLHRRACAHWAQTAALLAPYTHSASSREEAAARATVSWLAALRRAALLPAALRCCRRWRDPLALPAACRYVRCMFKLTRPEHRV